MTNRDDFSPAIKVRLERNVASICSNPECRNGTRGAHTDPTQTSVSIGVAAHICAAAPGGPRYDENMTPAQRMAFENGIWLCTSCSRLIDRDVDRYQAALLHKWKEDAEAGARQNIGRRVPAEKDVRDQLVMALSGSPIANQPNVIANSHAAVKEVHEQLDPRFRVETSFKDNVTHIVLHARETVPITFKVGPASVKAWQEGMRELLFHGRSVRLPTDGVQIHGSPLFERSGAGSSNVDDHIRFLPEGLPAVAKIVLRDPDSGELFALDDVRGQFNPGMESTSFAGSCYANLLSIELNVPRKKPPVECTFTISAKLSVWVGRDVRTLAYFEKVFGFYDRAKRGWIVDFHLEHEGDRVFGGSAEIPFGSESIWDVDITLQYTNRARVLANHTNAAVIFQTECGFTAEQHEELAELANIIRGKYVFAADKVGNIKHILTAEADAKNIEMLLREPGPHLVVMSGTPSPIQIFDQQVALPQIRKLYDDVTAQIDVDIATVEEGDEVPVTWLKGEAFRLTMELESHAEATARLATEQGPTPPVA